MRLALFEPDIPQNTGAIARLAACLGLALDIIEPAGFPVSDRAFRRAGMDYLDKVEIRRHANFREFEEWRRARGARLVLATTKASLPYPDFAFSSQDTIIFGRETAGAPQIVHESADARILVPMREGLRSLNVALVAAMIAGEALRQTGGFAGATPRLAEARPE
jgi:tRNA (cytidine/uridine-2'-O-)-methyltransferase